MTNDFTRLIREDQGQNLVEYALLAGLVSLVVLGAVTSVGSNLTTLYTSLAKTVSTILPQ